jgi:hypothetical protein
MDDWKQGSEASAGRCHSDGVERGVKEVEITIKQ